MLRAAAIAVLLPALALAEPADKAPPAALDKVATFALDTVSVVAWPLQLDTTSALLLGGAALGTVAMMSHDPHLYSQVSRVHWTVHRRSIFNLTLHLGSGLADLAIFGAFAFGGERARRTSVEGLQALVSVAVTSVLLKHLFRVPRPENDPQQKGYFKHFTADAFPSGHTMAAFATATVISGNYPGAAPFAYAAASLVGLSVMKKGWHWPSDVLAGGALGAIIGRSALKINSRHVSIVPAPGGIGVAAEL